MTKEHLSRRDFLKLTALGMGAITFGGLGGCIVAPGATPEPTRFIGPTDQPATETPALTPKPPPSPINYQEVPTATVTSNYELLTPEKIAFLATHNFYHGRTDEKITMMTYDEGWPRENVQTLLDIYRKRNVKCTFFMSGQGLVASRDLLPQLVDEGHILGCHSFNHEEKDEMTGLDDTQLEDQFKRWFDLKNQIIPEYQVRYFRAPFGSTNLRVQTFAAWYGMQHVGWTIESGGTTPETFNYVFNFFEENYKNAYGIGGAIVLSHTQRYFDVFQADKILDAWDQLGYKLVTVDEGKMDKDRWP